MTTGLSEFFTYNMWANLRLLDACSQLTDAQLDFTAQGVYGSIRETLIHIVAGEERDMRDCNIAHLIPNPPLDESTPFTGFDDLKKRSKHSGTALIAVAEKADPHEILNLPEDYIAPMFVVLIGVVSHALEHRSQIATLMSLQGIKPPRLDIWGYNNDVLRPSKS